MNKLATSIDRYPSRMQWERLSSLGSSPRSPPSSPLGRQGRLSSRRFASNAVKVSIRSGERRSRYALFRNLPQGAGHRAALRRGVPADRTDVATGWATGPCCRRRRPRRPRRGPWPGRPCRRRRCRRRGRSALGRCAMHTARRSPGSYPIAAAPPSGTVAPSSLVAETAATSGVSPSGSPALARTSDAGIVRTACSVVAGAASSPVRGRSLTGATTRETVAGALGLRPSVPSLGEEGPCHEPGFRGAELEVRGRVEARPRARRRPSVTAAAMRRDGSMVRVSILRGGCLRRPTPPSGS